MSSIEETTAAVEEDDRPEDRESDNTDSVSTTSLENLQTVNRSMLPFRVLKDHVISRDLTA